MTSALTQLTDRHASDAPLTEPELDAMLQWVLRHGPANCWTGTSGDPCRMIYALLIDRANLIKRMKAK